MSQPLKLTSNPEPENVPIWICKLEQKDKPWTVGEKRELHCQGESAFEFQSLPEIVFPPKKSSLKYSLHILKVKSLSKDKASFVVTSYKPGEHSSSFFILSQEGRVKVFNSLSWKVENTLKTKMGTLKPHGPMGPFLLSWPLELKILSLSFALLIFCLLSFKIYRFFLKKYWRKKMLKLLTPLSPYHELNKSIRSLLKKHPLSSLSSGVSFLKKKQEHKLSSKTQDLQLKESEVIEKEKSHEGEALQFEVRRNYIEGLEKSFFMFLGKVFLIPAHELKTRSLIKEIKLSLSAKKFRKIEAFNEIGDFKSLKMELRFLINELRKAKHRENQLKVIDCEHLTQWVRKWAGKMNDINEMSEKRVRFKRKPEN